MIDAANLERKKDMTSRQAHLLIVDALERRWGINPRTSQLRDWYKSQACGIIEKKVDEQPPEESAT